MSDRPGPIYVEVGPLDEGDQYGLRQGNYESWFRVVRKQDGSGLTTVAVGPGKFIGTDNDGEQNGS